MGANSISMEIEFPDLAWLYYDYYGREFFFTRLVPETKTLSIWRKILISGFTFLFVDRE